MLDRADVLARDRSADHLVDELEALAARQWTNLHVHVAELPMAAGLALEARVLLGRLADGFLVAGLRARGVDLHVETALEAFDPQLQMDLALAAPQHPVGVTVVLQTDRTCVVS